ncbi:MAG: DEAD/DEAH box helicase [Nitrincola lacisaponensis]|uniref:DEAD/DEAH box helicase n=1 Tax=Nitrincola lacisaponensis TaxID=267850 RepID=UPI00391DDA73
MSNSFYFQQFDPKSNTANFFKAIEAFADKKNIQVYMIKTPLGDNKYTYSFEDGAVLLIPKHKIIFINIGGDREDFIDYCDDFIEDLGSISDKYQYKTVIGRPRKWKEDLVYIYDGDVLNDNFNIESLLSLTYIKSSDLQKKGELLISLLTGSINDIDRVKESVPDNVLDKVKQKIQLFDGEQTRFVYTRLQRDKVTIQGLSGTGKTELLLHKLKEIYLENESNKVIFTCHNKILASSIKRRIPEFFNFMKVEKQIKWDERLWCVHAWGSSNDPDSGAYRYICEKYNLIFHRYSFNMPFSKACALALEQLDEDVIESVGYAFDYALIDESQDFPEEFVRLFQKVTKNTVYVAGDIFQSVFDENIVSEITPDYLLSKCYRTDPRTLMFAHALGMGLFEKKKLRWLSDDEWLACGYIVNKKGTEYELSREPLRRFEDIMSDDFSSIEVISRKLNEEPYDIVIRTISEIIENNPTVQANDIGVLFLGNQKKGFRLADILEQLIHQKFGWKTNKAYESKNKYSDGVFISNKNNVKGLEFPFVICVGDYISDLPHERNALYMLLTRSFIKSYLVITDEPDAEKISCIEKGLENINKEGVLKINAPRIEDIEKIRTRIEYDLTQKSLAEMIFSIFDDEGVPPLWRDPIFNLVKEIDKDKFDYESLKDLIVSTVQKMNIK